MAKIGDTLELLETGTGKLLARRVVQQLSTVIIQRGQSDDQIAPISGLILDGKPLCTVEIELFAILEGFYEDEPGCVCATAAMARFFATIYPTSASTPETATLHGHLTRWASARDSGRLMLGLMTSASCTKQVAA